jgi:hypothetical protein
MALSITNVLIDMFYKVDQVIKISFDVTNTSTSYALINFNTGVSINNVNIPIQGPSSIATLTSITFNYEYTSSGTSNIVISPYSSGTYTTVSGKNSFAFAPRTNTNLPYIPLTITTSLNHTSSPLMSYSIGDTITFSYDLLFATGTSGIGDLSTLGTISIQTSSNSSFNPSTFDAAPTMSGQNPIFPITITGQYTPTFATNFLFYFTPIFTNKQGVIFTGNTIMTVVDYVVPPPLPSVLMTATSIGSYSTSGQMIDINIFIKNTGNVELRVGDIYVGTRIVKPNISPSLAIGAQDTYHTFLQITQDDIDATIFSQQIAVTYSYYYDTYSSSNVHATTQSIFKYSISASLSPAINVQTSGPLIFPGVGKTYSFLVSVKNTGNVTVTNVTPTSEATFSPTSISSLAPNSTTTFTGSQIVKTSDLANGVNCNVSVTTNAPCPAAVL